MKRTLLTALQYLFFAALAAFFVWLSLKGMDSKKWTQLKDALDRANYWLLIPVLGLLLLSHWLRALRWRQLIQPLGYDPSRINCFLGVMIGYFVNLGAPRLGEVIKCTILARYEKVSADKLVGTIVAERAFDVVCLALVFGLTLVFQYDIIHTLTSGNSDLLFRSANGQISWIRIVGGIAVAVDAVGAGLGEVVLYASGSSARQTQVTQNRPVDATIMAIVDAVSVDGENRYVK